ncbi:MAG TPA: hypothetical protein ENK57_03555 [Polyangiaceae bacterium]|nr:hypothetical protein [Polyangiaceae bacterium]
MAPPGAPLPKRGNLVTGASPGLHAREGRRPSPRRGGRKAASGRRAVDGFRRLSRRQSRRPSRAGRRTVPRAG